MQLTVNLEGIDPATRHEVIRKLQFEDKARYDLGVIEQRRLAQLYRNLPVGAFKAGIGPAQLVMSPDQWQRAMNASDELRERCFQDPEFVPWLLRHNEDMRVKPLATKIQVGYRAPLMK